MTNSAINHAQKDFLNIAEEMGLYRQGLTRLHTGRNDIIAKSGVNFAQNNNVTPAVMVPPSEGSLLLIVDPNNDFVMEKGALPVEGALEDAQRLVIWMYNNVCNINTIVATNDKHLPISIFHPLFWRKQNGDIIDPYTIINGGNFMRDNYPIFMPDWDPDWVRSYIDQLKQTTRVVYDTNGIGHTIGKDTKDLMAWTTHCLANSIGDAFLPMILDAMLFWAAARSSNYIIIDKGDDPWTEWYSPLEAEVPVPGNPFTLLNTGVIDQIRAHKRTYIAGWASSHCVYGGLKSIIEYASINAPDIISKMYVLMDATSPVVVKDGKGGVIYDYGPETLAKYQEWSNQYGLNLVKTTDGGGFIQP